MREQREALLNQRRFGISTDNDVQNKIKEIFHTELNDLATIKDYNIPEGTANLIQKLIDKKDPEKSISEEGISKFMYIYTLNIRLCMCIYKKILERILLLFIKFHKFRL
jgi:hypothetical protein